MNKKFSTLLVAALLTAWGGTDCVYAQDVPTSVCDVVGGSIVNTTAFEDDEELAAGKYYFVQDENDKFLYLDNSTGAYQARLVDETVVNKSLTDIDQALWEIATQISEDGGTVRHYLLNKGTGLYFSYDPANASTINDISADSKFLGGAYPYWKWFEKRYNKDGQFGTVADVFSVAVSAGEYTMVLKRDANDVLYSYKYSEKAVAKGEEDAPNDFVKLKVVKAGAYVMSAKDLNTKETKDGVKYMQLDFGETANENNIFAQKLQAQQLNRVNDPAEGNPDEFLYKISNELGFTGGWTTGFDNEYLILSTLDKDENVSYKYVHVDTAYFASTGVSHKLYNEIAVTENAASFVEDVDLCFEKIANGLPLDAFRFKFVKNLETDKIWVKALVEAVELKEAADKYYNVPADNNRVTFWGYASNVGTNWPAIEEPKSAEEVKNGTGENLVLSHCTLQDETKKVVTFYECDADKTVNRVNLLASDVLSRDYKSLAEGVYKVYVKTATTGNKNYVGLYAATSLCGEFKYTEVVKQEVAHMPAYQWVVTKVVQNGTGAATSPIRIQNREFVATNFGEKPIHQLYKMEGLAENEYLYDGLVFVFEKIDPTTTLGYFNEDTEEDIANIKSYNLTYLSGLAGEGTTLTVGVDVTEKDAVLTVGKEAVRFNLHPVKKDIKYSGLDEDLKCAAYTLEVEDASVLTDSEKRYVMAENFGAQVKYILTEEENASRFMLKEQNCVDGTHYYALIELGEGTEQAYKAGVDDVTAQLIQECLCCEADKDCRISSFALTVDDTPLYRRLGVTNPDDEFEDMKMNIGKIFRTHATEREYLYEDVNSVYAGGKGINFLGVEGKGDNKDAGLTIDTAYVRYETSMPQYMFVMEAVHHESGLWCPDNEDHNDPEYVAVHGDCGHKVPTQAYTTGRYLINFADSVNLSGDAKDYQWNQKYTRLGFVDAKHIGDTLIIMRNGEPGTEAADSIFLGDNKHNMPEWTLNTNPSKNTKGDSIHAAHKYGIKNAVFALRLVNTDACDFLIETVGDKKIPSEGKGAWVAVKNGVPVVAEYATYTDAIADAEIFNIEKTDKAATDNEVVTVSEVKVLPGESNVTIAGAAGKKVVISNILGQVVANTVITSDNATIAAPQGVVVVAVEGEAAVKAIVK